MTRLEFFFDCSSPWTYLAFVRIQDILARTRVQVEWRPILVGGVFNAVNQEVYERRANPDPRKASYSEKDLQDWARLAGIRIGKPPVFPVRAVSAMRCVLAADEQGRLVPICPGAVRSLLGRTGRYQPAGGAGCGGGQRGSGWPGAAGPQPGAGDQGGAAR